MKLPLWVKGRDGKWHRFPYEALTYEDGRYLIRHENLGPILDLCDATGWLPSHFFDYYNFALDAYIFKETAGKET